MKIITVSRQFGSGGREMGKRLADLLGWDYYDKEIIETLAEEHSMEPDEIRRALSHHGWNKFQLTYRNSFSHMMFRPGMHLPLLLRQKEIIREIDYTPNAFAQGLGLNTMHTIGILVPTIADTYMSTAVSYVEGFLAAEGYHCILSCSGFRSFLCGNRIRNAQETVIAAGENPHGCNTDSTSGHALDKVSA